jgi:hypothetical protein
VLVLHNLNASASGDCPKVLVGKQTSKEETRCRWDNNNIKMWQEEVDGRVDLIGSVLGLDREQGSFFTCCVADCQMLYGCPAL